MTDALARLVRRTRQAEPSLAPRLATPFEGPPMSGEAFGDVTTETEVAASGTSTPGPVSFAADLSGATGHRSAPTTGDVIDAGSWRHDPSIGAPIAPVTSSTPTIAVDAPIVPVAAAPTAREVGTVEALGPLPLAPRRDGALEREGDPVVRITIGRVDVRADLRAAPPPKRLDGPGRPRTTPLEEYLARRARGASK